MWSSSGHVETFKSGGTLVMVSATFGGRSWSYTGCGGLFYDYNNKIELTGQGLCVGTGWTVQGVRECLRDRGPRSGLAGPWQKEGPSSFPNSRGQLFFPPDFGAKPK